VETKRLLVRRLTLEDAPALYEVLSDPAVMRYIEPPFTPEQTRAFLLQAGCCEPPLVYGVVWKGSADPEMEPGKGQGGSDAFKLIGHLIWHPWEDEAMELGWILRRDYWGRGIARELTAALLERTAGDVVLECSPDQTATRHLAERFGFICQASDQKLAVYRRRGTGQRAIRQSGNRQ